MAEISIKKLGIPGNSHDELVQLGQRQLSLILERRKMEDKWVRPLPPIMVKALALLGIYGFIFDQIDMQLRQTGQGINAALSQINIHSNGRSS